MVDSRRRAAFAATAACLLLLTASSATSRAAAFHLPQDARAGDTSAHFPPLFPPQFPRQHDAQDRSSGVGQIGSALESSYDRDAALELESTYEEDDDVARAAGIGATRGAGRDPAALIATSAGFAYPMAAPIYVAKWQRESQRSVALLRSIAPLSNTPLSYAFNPYTPNPPPSAFTDSPFPFFPLPSSSSAPPSVREMSLKATWSKYADPSPSPPTSSPPFPHLFRRAPSVLPVMMSLKATWSKWADLSSWDGSKPCDQWTRIKCWTDGTIRRMEMSGMGLRGSLPGIIGDLTTLEELLVTKNWFTHEFPNLSKLVRLKNLQVWSNYFNHTIPPVLGNLRSLYQLHLNINYFKGGIPNTFSQLTNLYRLFVSSNLLSGTFPSVICTMTTLRELRISGNHFEGSIPPCVSRLKLLYYMYVDTNRFTGRLPNSIGTMTNLQNLFINQNSIAGPLPATITRLRKLRILFMSSNPKLTGRLPRNLGNMVGLTDLVMEFCNFSGPIPPSITRLTRLQRLLLDNNYFRGIVPENLSRLTDITILYLERNFLYGTFPKGISQLPKLAYLNLHSNLLTGPLPTNFPSTRFIDYGQYNLRNNFFNGPAVVTAGGRSFCPVNHTYTGVFFESSLAKNCLTYPVGSPCEKAGLVQVQVPTHVCKRFCNADTNTCGGKGYCWFGGGRNPSCDCFRGFKPTADKQLCVKA
ncbi:unnamed protein product [Closterium sp. NIES-65]|nr:unnamed protein product [Closterium sp. NIES-65]